MRRPQGEGLDILLPNERRLLVGGWLLRLRGKEWFRCDDVVPIMTDLYNADPANREIEAVGGATVARLSKNLGELSLLETEWRGLKAEPKARPMRFHRLTETGLEAGPSLYLQYQLPLLRTPEALRQWLETTEAALIIEGQDITKFPPDLSEETVGIN